MRGERENPVYALLASRLTPDSLTSYAMSEMTPQEIVHELDKHIVGQDARQARRRHRAAQPLAPPAGGRAAAPGNHAEEHPDDRPDRRRQDRDRAPPGQARRCAVHQGRGDQVHRSRLCRARRGHHHPRPGRDRHQADARAGNAQGAAPRRGRSPRSASSTCCCRRRASRLRAPAAERRRTPRGRNSARSCAKASSTTRKSRSKSRRAQAHMEILAPPGMEELTSQIQGMFQNLGGARSKHAQAEDPRSDEAADRRRGGASWSTTKT